MQYYYQRSSKIGRYRIVRIYFCVIIELRLQKGLDPIVYFFLENCFYGARNFPLFLGRVITKEQNIILLFYFF